VNDFKIEAIKELTDKIRGLTDETVRFELYLHSEIKPQESIKANQDVEKVPMLLEELKRDYGLNYEIKDTCKMSVNAVKTAYKLGAHWAMTTERSSVIRRMINDIFVGGEAGDYFGKQIPAMIIHYHSHDVLCVLPHVIKRPEFCLTRWVRSREHGNETKIATITIYDSLTALKDARAM